MARARVLKWCLVAVGICVAPLVFAEVSSSTNYQIELDSVNFSGGFSSSTNYGQESTFGELASGEGTGTNYTGQFGYLQSASSSVSSSTTTPQCDNDNVCEDGENAENCPGDCPVTTVTPPPTQVNGCTNTNAANYNASATTDDGSCIYLHLGVNNLSIAAGTFIGAVDLSWENPTSRQGFSFGEVRILRSVSIPGGPFDGSLVYAGSGERVEDSGLSLGVRYYYAAYVRNTLTGQYSAASVVSIVLGTEEEEVPCTEDCEEDEVVDIFDEFPDAQWRLPDEESFAFDVIQADRITKFAGGMLFVSGDAPFTMSLDYDLVPEVLKTIGVTIKDPKRGTAYSFVLRVDKNKQSYAATIIPFLPPGEYPITIHLFDYENQRLKKISGTLVVSRGTGALVLARAAARVAAPVAVALGAASGIVQGLALATKVNSLYDVYLLGLRFMGALFGALGLRKKRVPWGTVYDSVTKRPLDPAYVSALRWKEEYRSAITDIDGRYGFFLPPGIYTLSVQKTHYRFPSTTLTGATRDEMYDNLYFGEEIVVNEGELLSRNIPMDPEGFDWNEFAKDKSGFIQYHSRRELIRARIFNAVYGLGFAVAILTLFFSPALFNVGVVCAYAGIMGATVYWRGRHRVVAVKNSLTGEPIPFAIVRFFIPGITDEVKSVVTDELGRFYQILRPGEYEVTVEERQSDGTYKLLYRSLPMNLSGGILHNDIEFVPANID